jgi:hypothetical protein
MTIMGIKFGVLNREVSTGREVSAKRGSGVLGHVLLPGLDILFQITRSFSMVTFQGNRFLESVQKSYSLILKAL